MTKVIAIDVPARHCPWCDQAVGPLTGIHYANENGPNRIEDCELAHLRKLADDLHAWRGKRNLSAMPGGVELLAIALDAEKLVLRRSSGE